jgi:hypothetical protein
MSKLMVIVGILFAALGVALGLMVFFSPGSMQVYGLTLEVAALFLVGGVLAVGLGGVIGAAATATAYMPAPAMPAPAMATAAPGGAAIAIAPEPLSPSVRETIQALEQAKTDLREAFAEKEPAPPATAYHEAEPERVAEHPLAEAHPAEEPAAEEAQPEEPEVEEAAGATAEEEGQLYVVEERTIRGRPARILSDGTVEAETSEGWMRFENLEHLDEYLDAMGPAA